jgi:hypothetical protein
MHSRQVRTGQVQNAGPQTPVRDAAAALAEQAYAVTSLPRPHDQFVETRVAGGQH